MPSIVWGRDSQEAFENPYEYAAQEQFVREAAALLLALYKLLNCGRHHYHRDDRSAIKAVWLLHMDALDGLFDSLQNLAAKRPRVAALIFRAIEESLDLATLFAAGSPAASALLGRWFDNEVVPHREYREYLREVEGPDAAAERAARYHSLSKFTHRTYRAIADTYSLGAGDRLVHERTGMLYGDSPEPASTLVLPHTMAAYYAVLASLIIVFTEQLDKHQLVRPADLETAILASLEEDTVPRRFMPSRWLRFFDPGLKAGLRASSEEPPNPTLQRTPPG
jgi:hypothetical protein